MGSTTNKPGPPAGSQPRPAADEAGAPPQAAPPSQQVDGVLRDYLYKSTRPNMRAVRPPAAPATHPGRSEDAAPAEEQTAQPPGLERPSWPLSCQDDDGFRDTGRFEVELPPHAVQARNRAVLIRIDGPTGGQVVSLAMLPMLIGRGEDIDLHLTDIGVSRRHARLLYEQGGYFVEDLGSRNGTFVAGRPARRAQLQDGDLVQLGPQASFRFALMDLEQETVLRRLYDSSVYDPLTGAHNRRYLDERLASEIAFALRHRTEASLLLFDIDFFKHINDGHGHAAGDVVLKTIAQVVRAQLRTEDVFARYGGEEFAVVLRSTDLAGAVRAGERIRQGIARTSVDLGGIRVAVTVSIGCASLACCPQPAPQALLDLADHHLYRAKAAGRNRVMAPEPA